jgi:hypothetical protein
MGLGSVFTTYQTPVTIGSSISLLRSDAAEANADLRVVCGSPEP